MVNAQRFLVSVILYFCFYLGIAFGQNSGNQMFDNSILHEIRFEFTESNYWSILTSNYENNNDPFLDKPYLMGTVSIDGEVVDSVGVRFKGFTSYFTITDKKPIKIDFNEFVKGKRFDGLRKLNLNNATGDPSMQRDLVCYDLLRSSGVNAPRTSFSKVYFNDVFWGVYQNIEQVDKEFLQNNFSNPDGNLFKNLAWSKFEWLGLDSEPYSAIFELKTNKDQNDWSGFINFINVLNNTEDQEFEEAIEEIFNVDLFLKTLAVDVATNNWDSYLEHGRNWYVYEDTSTGKIHWIPWDYNFALNGNLFQSTECDLFPDFVAVQDGTTTIDFYDDTFTFGSLTYEWDFGDGQNSTSKNPSHTYTNPGLYTVCLTVFEDDDCFEQVCKAINTAVNLNDCPSIIDGSCPHGIGKNFATILEFNPDCCEIWGTECEEFYQILTEGNGGFSSNFKFDQRENEGVLIRRLLQVPEFFDRYLGYACALLQNYFKEDKYHAFIESNKELIEFAVEEDPNLLSSFQEFLNDTGDMGLKQIIAERLDSLSLDLQSIYDCAPSPYILYGDIVINEFVASNDSLSGITDEFQESEDWIELYNNTSEDIDLSQAFLSDESENLLKWKFPPGSIIAPDDYLIVWADMEEDQGRYHCNFKLAKDGEKIFLSNVDQSFIDEVSYTSQETNIASARIPNGTGIFKTQAATFNSNNEGPNGVQIIDSNIQLKIYPNPVTDYLTLEILNKKQSNYQYEILSIDGIPVMKTTDFNSHIISMSTSQLPSGFYLINLYDDLGNMTTAKFAKL